MKSQLKIVLASTSPQRIAILNNAGFSFTTISPLYTEIDDPNLSPKDQAIEHALMKGRSIIHLASNSIIIGCDTVVELANQLIGKPTNAQHAREIIALQQGKSFNVISGLAVINTLTNQELITSVSTKVIFNSMSDSEIDEYISSNEWKDKSGAFSIQGLGSKFISSIEGDYYNVVGLPISQVYQSIQTLTQQ
jgi:septum formation protein